MAKISINLLPSEFTEEEVKRAKFYKIQAFGVAILLVMVFLSSLTAALRILQNRSVNLAQAQLTEAEKRVVDLKDRQVSLVLLKNRLSTIGNFLGIPSKQAATYELVNNLLPASVQVSAVTVERSGETTILALVPDVSTLDNLLTKLVDKDASQEKISQVSIESLSRGKDGIYRLSLVIKPK